MTNFLGDVLTRQNLWFNRPFAEVRGYYMVDSTLIINALGVDGKDIKVEVNADHEGKQLLRVFGETKAEHFDEPFTIDIVLVVRKPIKKITKSVKNGLVYLTLEYNEPAKPEVEIVEA